MKYEGSELALFATARNWKRYVRERIAPYIGGSVLEVGAGIGGFTKVLAGGTDDRIHWKSWCCLEPDADLVAEIGTLQRSGSVPPDVRIVCGTLADVDPAERFDTILYLDVIEHILDDVGEVARAVSLLRPGGHIVILVPAFQFVYSPFDAQIGHHRRYTRRSLDAIRPAEARGRATFYLDAPGLLLSCGNRLFLKRSAPSPAQIHFWDSYVVPIARRVDPLVARSVGRSFVGIWQR